MKNEKFLKFCKKKKRGIEVENKTLTGEVLLESLLIRGEYADGFYTPFTDGEIYVALLRCRRLINVSIYDSDYSPSCSKKLQKPLSPRQDFCANSAIKFIMASKYNYALHELQDCIDDYGKGKNRPITVNEYILYNCIINCFIARFEEQDLDGYSCR